MTDRSREDAILRLARQRSLALVHKDSQAMEALLAEEFRYINASGMVLGRDDYIDNYVKSDEVRWSAQDLDECSVTIYGDTAVLTCRVRDCGRMGAESFEATYRSIFVWAERAGEWRCVVGQTTAVDPGD